MAEEIDGNQMRRVLLEVIQEKSRASSGSLQSGSILKAAARRLGIRRNKDLEQALLTFWYDLFRTGHLSWGHNLLNADPPFCHLTEQGRRTLENLSRDPANPDGYQNYLLERGDLSPIARSYVEEALRTYNADCYKAAAVMIGAASESLILEIRDVLVRQIQTAGGSPPRKLKDWRVKTVLDAMKRELEGLKQDMPRGLVESFEAYWPAFTQQIRAARNEAGHPSSIEPVTQDVVHAALLIFPELACLAFTLESWIVNHYA